MFVLIALAQAEILFPGVGEGGGGKTDRSLCTLMS